MQNRAQTRNNKTGRTSANDTTDPQVQLTATSGDSGGEIDLSWEAVKSADNYLIQRSTDLKKPLKWLYEDVVSKSTYTVSKLKSGRRYWFRVAAITRKGQSRWSNPVQKKAP